MKWRATAAILALAMGATPPNPARAQDPVELKPLTIYGEKFARPLDETATSVRVYLDSDIEDRAAESVFDLFALTPNVEISRDERDIVIRGVAKDGLAQTQDILTQSDSDVITTYLDGAAVSSWAGATSTWDLEQVEILRGVQTNTFGRGAIAGAVVLKSADPVYEYEARARGLFSDPEAAGGSAMLNLPIVDDTAALRFAVDYSDQEGTIHNLTRDTFEDPDEHLTLRGKALIEPSEDISALFSVTYSDRERGSGFLDLARFPEDRVAFSDEDGTLRNELIAGSALFTFDATDTIVIEAQTAITTEDADRSVDGDATALPIITAQVAEDLFILSQEVRAKYDSADNPLSGFIGVNLRRFERDIRNQIPAFGLDIEQDQDSSSLGVFGELRYEIVDGLAIYGGGRFDAEALDFSANTSSEDQSDTFTAFSPKIGISWDLTDQARLIAEVERGRRAGGAGVSLLTGTSYVFDEEQALNYELTARTSWLGDRLTVDATAFYTEWEDQQVNALTFLGSPFDTTIVNAGESTQYGIELESALQVADDVRLSAGFCWLETEFDRFVVSGQDLSGNEFPNAPRFSASAAITWRPLAGPLAGAFATADLSWRDAYFSDAENTQDDRVDDRTLVGLAIGYEWQHARITGFVRNLLDDDYLTVSTTSLGTGAAGAPRTFGVVGEIRF